MKSVLLTFLLICIPQISHADLMNGLVGWWKLDESSGVTAIDSSGNNNNGDLTGHAPTWTTGIKKGSLSFNGTTQYVSIPDSTSLRPNNTSISAWFNCSSFPGMTSIVTKPQTAAAWTNPYLSFLIRLNSSSQLELDVGNTTYSNNSINISPLSANTWYHIALTYDGTTVTSYLNGTQIGTNNIVSGNIAYAAYPVLIGADYGGAPLGEYFPGKIDDVRIWNRTLTPTEINNLYLGGLGRVVYGKNSVVATSKTSY